VRAYSITLTDPSGAVYTPPSLRGANLQASWASFVSGKDIPGALNVELDAPVFTLATPMGRAWVRVWGISLQEIRLASQLTNFTFKMSAGMSRGLPLANQKQYGPVLQGKVYQALGNWQGTDQTLDLFIYPDVGTIDNQANLTLHWPANASLGQALQDMLRTAYPTFTIQVNINSNLVQARDETGTFTSLEGLAQWCRQKSLSILGGTNYLGVAFSAVGSTIIVYDNGVPLTSTAAVKKIAFTDMIGQPVWLDFPTISFKTVMRSDISIGDYIELPPNVATATPGSLIGTPLRSSFVVQGTYQVQVVRHLGNFRQPDADSWVTAFNAYPVMTPS
jgi:hypothetical protein